MLVSVTNMDLCMKENINCLCLPFFTRLYIPTTCADRIMESTDRQYKVGCTDKKLRVRLNLNPGRSNQLTHECSQIVNFF